MPVIAAMESIYKIRFPSDAAVVKKRLIKTYIETLLSDKAKKHRDGRSNAFSKVSLLTSFMVKMLSQWDQAMRIAHATK